MHNNNSPLPYSFLSLKLPPPPCAVLLVVRFSCHLRDRYHCLRVWCLQQTPQVQEAVSGSSCVVSWKFFTDACAMQRVLRTFDKCPSERISAANGPVWLACWSSRRRHPPVHSTLEALVWRRSLQLSLCTWDIFGWQLSDQIGSDRLSPRTCCGTGGCGLRCSPGDVSCDCDIGIF